jgi:hypothetical protein
LECYAGSTIAIGKVSMLDRCHTQVHAPVLKVYSQLHIIKKFEYWHNLQMYAKSKQAEWFINVLK